MNKKTTGPLATNPNPLNIEAGPLGKIYITGIMSGLGWLQDNPVSGDDHSLVDLSNLHSQNIELSSRQTGGN